MNTLHIVLTTLAYALALTGSMSSDKWGRLARILRATGLLLPLIDALVNPVDSLGFQRYFVALASLVAIAVTLHSEGYYRVLYGKTSYQETLLNTTLVTILTVFNTRILGEFVMGLLLLDILLMLVILMDKGAENYRVVVYYITLSAIPADIAVLSTWAMVAQGYGLEASITTSLTQLASNPITLHPLAALLILLGYATKLGLFPIHVWLPIVHPEAPKHGSAILSGLIIKIGVFGLLLSSTIFIFDHALYYLTLVQGVITAIYGSFAATLQRDIRRLLAYSSLGHAGIIAILYSLSMIYGETVLLYLLYFYIVYHGLVKAHAFMNAALIDQLANTFDIYSLGYLGQVYPETVAPAFNIFANFAGIPPSYGFVMKLMVLATAILLVSTHGLTPLLTGVAVAITAVLSILYSVKILGCYIGGYRKVAKPPIEVPRSELASEYYLTAVTLVFPLVYIATSVQYIPIQLSLPLVIIEAISLPLFAWLLVRKPVSKTMDAKYWLSGVEQ